MFKFFVGIATAVCLLSNLNAEDVLKKWDSSNKFGGVILYNAKGWKAQKSYDAAAESPKGKGVLKIKVLEAKGKGASQIQLMFRYGGKIQNGQQYKISMNYKLNQSGSFIATAIMHQRPWRGLGKGHQKKVTAQAGKWETLEYAFTADKDFPKVVRVPCLFFGMLPVGTEIDISSVTFSKK